MREALFYERLGDKEVRCLLCPQECRIKPGREGVCRVRRNLDGTLYTENYGRYSSIAMDPIEKKPLYHFYPGSLILSLGTKGCNLRCGFCQNWEISQGDPLMREITPQESVDIALKYRGRGCIGIAYTYSEPAMWFEFVLETARVAREKGLANVLVTNGYINPAPLEELLPFVDAMNIDVKAFTEDFYRKVCKGRLEPVLKVVEMAAGRCHVELTTLIIPGYNDSPDEIGRLVEWIASIDEEIPLHFSRYFPNYKFDDPPTPVETLRMAREIALEKLRYVYIGNVSDERYSTTYCYRCGGEVIRRRGMGVEENRLRDGKCPECGTELKIYQPALRS